MWYSTLFETIEQQVNLEQAEKMSAYMQNKFRFLGIPKPQLMLLIKPYIKATRLLKLDWEFVFLCWEKDYREAQYVAIEYLNYNYKKLTVGDIPKLQQLIVSKSWWETVDALDSFVGFIVQNNWHLIDIMLEWSKDDNIWLRRVSIDFQQKFKDKTDIAVLEQVIINNFGSSEFFINKSIGWSLREYSKTDPNWVLSFLEKYSDQMSKLSIKEASKYLNL